MPNLNKPEQWRDVVGHEGVYQVSDHGRVRSVDRMIPRAASKGGGVQKARGRILAPRPSQKGRMSVNLSGGGAARNYLVHRLVCAAFLGPCPPGEEVNHKDCNPRNNALHNLEYVTHQRNQEHAYENGRIRPVARKGVDHGRARLSDDDIRHIRALRQSGRRVEDIAHQFKTSTSSVSNICLKRSWKHVTEVPVA